MIIYRASRIEQQTCLTAKDFAMLQDLPLDTVCSKGTYMEQTLPFVRAAGASAISAHADQLVMMPGHTRRP